MRPRPATIMLLAIAAAVLAAGVLAFGGGGAGGYAAAGTGAAASGGAGPSGVIEAVGAENQYGTSSRRSAGNTLPGAGGVATIRSGE